MMSENEIRSNYGEGTSELKQLLQWIKDNPQKWLCVCDPEFFDLPPAEKLELIESLENAGLYAVAYVVFWSAGSKSRKMEEIRNRFVNGLIAEFSVREVMARVKEVIAEAADNDAEVSGD